MAEIQIKKGMTVTIRYKSKGNDTFKNMTELTTAMRALNTALINSGQSHLIEEILIKFNKEKSC